MNVGRIIVNTSLALSLMVGFSATLIGIVYADRQKQLDSALQIGDEFHRFEIVQRGENSSLNSKAAMNAERIAQLTTTLNEVRSDVKLLLQRTK